MSTPREIALAAYGGEEPGRMKTAITREIGIKRCRECREWLPIEAFGAAKDRADGLQQMCRGCTRTYYNTWRSRPGNTQKQREYTRRCRQSDPDRTARNRLRDRCKTYGITVEDYDRMLSDQGGGCAICGATAEDNGRALAIDHDHRCCPEQLQSCGSCVRGLLCSPCNVAVGYFEREATRTLCEAYVQRTSPVGPG